MATWDMSQPSVCLEPSILEGYNRISLYNSPYPAHENGCAVDCYPDGDDRLARSPIAGTVLETATVRAPAQPYALPNDHVIVLECADSGVTVPRGIETPVRCRILHVNPTVEPGGRIERGDVLGTLIRSGFFAPWVDRHLHVGFRPADCNPIRATGSLRLEAGISVTPLAWDGRGTVIDRGETSATLEIPEANAERATAPDWTGIGADSGGVLDGGLAHYDGGGLIGGPDGPVHLLGSQVGTATDKTVRWDDLTVTVDGSPITGLSLFYHHGKASVKLIWPDHPLWVGDSVRVRIALE